MTDNELLSSFFDQARQPVADDGFTNRVMSRLTASSEVARLRRLRRTANIVAIVAMTALAAFILATRPPAIDIAAMHLDAATLVVRAVLLVRQLPQMLPSLAQCVALMAVLAIVTHQSLRTQNAP